MALKFLINSHARFFEKTSLVLLESMYRECPLLCASDIIVVVGGCSKLGYSRLCGVREQVYLSPHNAFDLTAFIGLFDLGLLDQHKSWFYIHDTCRVGPGFYQAVHQISKEETCKPVTHGIPSMNMGFYTSALVRRYKDFVDSFRNTDESPESLQQIKARAIEHEDFLFRGNYSSFYSPKMEIIGHEDVYGTGSSRQVEYYHDVDLYKFKANWHRKEKYELGF